jgi:hypothetical protein
VNPDLRLEPSDAGPPAPPPPRGRLLTAAQIASDLFTGTVSPTWVRRRVPHRLRLGHSTVRWFEADVLAWLAGQRSP